MNASQLIAFYPNLFHITSSGAWESIRSHGLQSTTAILDRFGKKGNAREDIECRRRPESVSLSHPVHGEITIRDQKPLSDIKVERGLSGCSIEDWYRLLNRKVFFWTGDDRLQRLLNGRAYQNLTQQVLVIDTASLVSDYGPKIRLCHKNSGAMRAIHPIGPYIFKTIEEFDPQLKRDGQPARPVVELTVDYEVADVANYIVDIQLWVSGKKRGTISP